MDPLTARNRRQLDAVRAACVRDLRIVWEAWDVNDEATWPRFAIPAVAIVRRHAAHAASLGVDYYAALRAKRTGRVSPQPTHPDPPHADAIAASLSAVGLAGTYIAVRNGRDRDSAKAWAFRRVARAAARHVANGARTAVLEAARNDRRALGWSRQVAGTCDWCEEKAAEGNVPPGEAFQAHDGCHCVAEPVFRGERAVTFDDVDDADKWGRSWTSTAWEAADDATRAAFKRYKGNAFKEWNEYLRGSGAVLRAEALEDIARVDRLMVSLPDTAQVSRRVMDASFIPEVGETFVDNSFTSTTIAGYQAPGSVLIEIVVPRGTRAFYDAYSGWREAELLLARGTRFKVVSKSETKVVLEVVVD